MKYVIRLVLLNIIFYSPLSFSTQFKFDDTHIENLAINYELKKLSIQVKDQNCHQYPACPTIACHYLGTLKCNDPHEIQEVAKICRGNKNGECLRQACLKLGPLKCNDLDEVRLVAKACRNNDESCLKIACDHLGTLGCNDPDEIHQVGMACKGVDGACLKSACHSLGTFGCNTIDKINLVSKACKGE